MSTATTPIAEVPAAPTAAPAAVSFAEALRFWLKLGFISFGGPAGQIALMHRELVERRRWISEKRFLHAPLVIAVVSKTSKHPKVPPWEQEMSAGASAMNIVHAAHALGYVANWLTGWPVLDDTFLRHGLELHPGEWVAGVIHIGTEGAVPPERPRPDLEATVTWFDL